MSQRDSGYERKERDLYETPEWVTEALMPHIPFCNGRRVWEPACGSGKMLRVLEKRLGNVCGTDIAQPPPMPRSYVDTDFLKTTKAHDVYGIVTNPPYVLAQEFCEHALRLMEEPRGFVAMLLRTDFDHAKTRQHLFSGCRQFAKKLVLTKRIKWFEDSKGQPSFNHAWFIWDWHKVGEPVIAYGPTTSSVPSPERS